MTPADNSQPLQAFEDVAADISAQLFCMGQDWKKGDGSASRVDGLTAKLTQAALALVEAELDKELSRIRLWLEDADDGNDDLRRLHDDIGERLTQIRKQQEGGK